MQPGTAIGIAVGLIIASACASGPSPAERGVACDLRPADSVFLRGAPLYRDCSVSRQARRVGQTPEVEFPRARESCQKATIEFVVGSDGVPELATARVTETNSPGYAEAVLKTLPYWTYEPARIRDLPVRQIVKVQEFLAAEVVRVTARQTREPIRLSTPASRDRPVGC